MIEPGDLLTLGQLAAPTVAAYVSCRVGIARALQDAKAARLDARRANSRIDHLYQLLPLRKTP